MATHEEVARRVAGALTGDVQIGSIQTQCPTCGRGALLPEPGRGVEAIVETCECGTRFGVRWEPGRVGHRLLPRVRIEMFRSDDTFDYAGEVAHGEDV